MIDVTRYVACRYVAQKLGSGKLWALPVLFVHHRGHI